MSGHGRTHLRFAAKSLSWDGDDLVDYVGGGDRITLDGEVTEARRSYGYPFNRAVVSPSGRYWAVYDLRGTKGVVLGPDPEEDPAKSRPWWKGVKILREIDRSYYHARDYEYPITLGTLANGEEAIVHCPDSYCSIAIDRVEDGSRVATWSKESSVFHSRLSLSPSGRWLLSAGWVWHPFGFARVYDAEKVIADPQDPDNQAVFSFGGLDAEAEGVCWLSDNSLVVSTNPEWPEDDDPDRSDPGLSKGELGIWSMTEHDWVSRCRYPAHTGTMLPFGDWVLSLYDHPKLLDPMTGSVLDEWPEIRTGTQTGSIHPSESLPPVAVDATRDRFAVGGEEEIVVVEVSGG